MILVKLGGDPNTKFNDKNFINYLLFDLKNGDKY